MKKRSSVLAIPVLIIYIAISACQAKTTASSTATTMPAPTTSPIPTKTALPINSVTNTPRGNIVFREKDPASFTKSIILVMDADGNFIRKVGEFGGSPTWSPDGKFIAVGCEKEICILDFATMPDMRNNLGMRSNSPKSAYRLPAPDRCEEKVNYGHGELYSGILSMSWSPSGKKLAVVCGSEDPKEVRSVCILSLDGGTECWDESLSQDIYRAVWSPMDENVIAIAGPSVAENTSEITLVNARGQNPIQLARGWSPEWSPDGKQIAYAQMTQEHLGIAIINRDGTGFRWANHAIQNFDYDCRRFTGTCRLSWSPDGRYIVFTSPLVYGHWFGIVSHRFADREDHPIG